MNIKEIFKYFKDKKQPETPVIDLTEIGSELRELMRKENADRIMAVFLEDYMPELYTIVPCEKMLNLSFGYNDDLNMVGKMLIGCAREKHKQRIKNTFESSKIAEKPYSVMLYDADSKKVVGGLTIYQDTPNCVASVVNERERQLRLKSMKKDVM